MTAKGATEAGQRLAEILGRLDALERALDQIEDRLEAAWDEAVFPTTVNAAESQDDGGDDSS